MTEALEQLAVLLLLDLQLLLALFLRFPGGNLLSGGCRSNGFNYSPVVAENIIAPFGGFLRDGIADYQLTVVIRVTIHSGLNAGGEQQSCRGQAGNNR